MTQNDIETIKRALSAGPTTGPWASRGSLGPQSNPSLKGPCVIERASSGQSLAHMTGWRTDQQTADARYIAAVHPERIARLLAELDRLRTICVSAHDRLLRGDDDRELLALLATAWEKQ